MRQLAGSRPQLASPPQSQSGGLATRSFGACSLFRAALQPGGSSRLKGQPHHELLAPHFQPLTRTARRMKAEHVKAQADAAFQGANYGVAAEK